MDPSSESISTKKTLINCNQLITNENPTTKNWLNNLSFLKTIDIQKASMSHKKILEGILQNKRNVVAKISDRTENLKIEYDTYITLRENNISGIVHYYCYFECNDNINRYNQTNNESLCNGPGNGMQVLLMEYIQNKSLAIYNWNESNKNGLISCLKQTLCIALDAFMKVGFIHGDLHCHNILIKKSKQNEIDYGFIKVKTNGYKSKLMDFELSKMNQNVKEFYKHMRLVYTSSILRYVGEYSFINQSVLNDIIIKVSKMWDNSRNKEDALWILEIVDLLDKLI